MLSIFVFTLPFPAGVTSTTLRSDWLKSVAELISTIRQMPAKRLNILTSGEIFTKVRD